MKVIPETCCCAY